MHARQDFSQIAGFPNIVLLLAIFPVSANTNNTGINRFLSISHNLQDFLNNQLLSHTIQCYLNSKCTIQLPFLIITRISQIFDDFPTIPSFSSQHHLGWVQIPNVPNLPDEDASENTNTLHLSCLSNF